MITPHPELKISTPRRSSIPRNIMTVAGTVAKKPGVCTSTRRRTAPITMSSHPRAIPSRSTMINDLIKRIKSYGSRFFLQSFGGFRTEQAYHHFFFQLSSGWKFVWTTGSMVVNEPGGNQR
jgi:hypothetical protein